MIIRQNMVTSGVRCRLTVAMAAVAILSAFAGIAACMARAANVAEPQARLLRLVMVEERGCRYCLAWEREVGQGYVASEEGRQAPVHRVPREAAVLAGLKPVVYTPTFILMREGAEIGRITGYPGAAYFWEELRALFEAPEARLLDDR